MKNSLFLLILLVGANLYGQTDSIEKAIINNKLQTKKIGQDKFSEICDEWFQQLALIKYPDLPLDKNGQVHYIFRNEFMGFNKENLFKRTIEWLSINYGLIPSNIYSNLEDGKIIFRNNIDLITGNTCNYTAIISIKNEKIKMEIINISYQTFIEGEYYSFWTKSLNINEVYPIILKKPSEWNSNLKLLKATNEFINTEIKNLYDYILSYENPSTF